MLPSSRTYGFWLALVRIYTGFFWLEHGLGKLHAQPAFGAPGGQLSQFLSLHVRDSTGPYHEFLTGFVVPNATLVGYAVMLGEMTAGALLLVGLFTRLGALLGVFLAVNYWLARGGFNALAASSAGVHGLGASSGLEICAAALTAISLVLPTGRVLGLDMFWPGSRKRPVAPRAYGGQAPQQGGP